MAGLQTAGTLLGNGNDVRNGSFVKLEFLSDESLRYLQDHSDLMETSASRLCALIIKTVCDDKLIPALFDDAKARDLIPQGARRTYKRRRTAVDRLNGD